MKYVKMRIHSDRISENSRYLVSVQAPGMGARYRSFTAHVTRLEALQLAADLRADTWESSVTKISMWPHRKEKK